MLRRPLVVVLVVAVVGSLAGAVHALEIVAPGPSGADPPPAAAARSELSGVSVAGGRVVVDTTADRPDADPGDGRCPGPRGRCTLRAAVMEANAGDELRSVVLTRRTYTLRRQGSGEDESRSGDLDVRSSLTIAGRGARIRARGDRVLDVARGVRLALSGARLTGGAPPQGESGGAIRSAGRLALTRVTVARSATSGDAAAGGGIFNDGGTVLLRGAQVNRNAADTGGGIASAGGTVLLRDVRVLLNEATDGGGIALEGDASADLRDTEVDRNRTRAHGGGARVAAGTALLALRTSFDANVAGGAGGAVQLVGGDLRLSVGTASENRAGAAGGAVRNEGGTVVVEDSDLMRNTAGGDGGAVSAAAATTALTGVQVNENRGRDGGALHVSGGALRVDGAVMQANVAAGAGGALAVERGSTVAIDGGSYLVVNRAEGGGGGAIVNDGGRVTVAGGPLSGNEAPRGDGGGVLNRGGTIALTGAELGRNHVGGDGGGIAVLGGDAMLADGTIDENTAARGGGVHVRAGARATIGGDRGGRIAGNRATAQGGGIWTARGAELRLARTNVIANVAPRGAERFDAG